MIPISAVNTGLEEERLVLEVLRSGQLAQGPFVEQLEREFAAFCGVDHAVAVSSGTTALVATLQALDIGPGDEIITSSFSFAATLNAILEVGAVARFADIDDADFTIDPEAVAALVNDRTRAILPVHLYGQPADMVALSSVAKRCGLAIIEDAAQAHGAEVAGHRVGSFGVGCFSLYATKNLTSGEGGLVTTNDKVVADRLRLLRNQGMNERYVFELVGHNYRLTDLQAAVALPQLRRLDDVSVTRRDNAASLSSGLGNIKGLGPPPISRGRTHVFHQYTVRVGIEAALTRDALVAALRDRGIGTGVYYPRLVFDHACYRTHPGVVLDDTPRAARAAQEVLSLPVHPALSAVDLASITRGVRDALGAPEKPSSAE